MVDLCEKNMDTVHNSLAQMNTEQRKGFTTGSCASAAAKAAVYMLLSGRDKEEIAIETPAGIRYQTAILEIEKGEEYVSCAVRKYSGDDPDVTNGMLIYAGAKCLQDRNARVLIQGGTGVGTVTRPGLDQPVGNAAINSVPRKMIEKEVREVMDIFDCRDSIEITISAPEGVEIAAKTFNPRLGIEGGISIIGTTGIVEPMSTKAILDTIYVELRQQKEEGRKSAVISPGNYGRQFLFDQYGYDLDLAVKCANYIGDTTDMVRSLGFRKMLFAGHAGKLVKVAGGIMNTHSKEADCRMEIIASAAIRHGASKESLSRILDCLNTREAYEILKKEGIEKECFSDLAKRVQYYLNKRAQGEVDVECMIYMAEYGLLGMTEGAEEILKEGN